MGILRGTKNDCVVAYTQGREAWRIGILGFFIRIPGLVSSILLAILTMGSVPFWWPKSFITVYELKLIWIVMILLGLVGLIVITGFFYLRKRSIRSLEIKNSLHDLSHYLREKQTSEFKRLNRESDDISDDTEEEMLGEFIVHLAEHLKNNIKLHIPMDDSIEVAIRIVCDIAEEKGKIKVVYRTFGRSSGLNPNRSATSEDISANEGIPRYFIEEKQCQGILIYNNIEEAVKKGLFKKTKNEHLYPSDIKTFVVAPLNAWDGKKQRMIGLLYVTSRKENVFKLVHVDVFRFLSDMIAQSIAFVVLNRKARQNRKK